MPEHHQCSRYLQQPEEGVGFSETGITDSCEALRKRTESNLGPLQELPLLLTAESFFQTLILIFAGIPRVCVCVCVRFTPSRPLPRGLRD